METAPLISLNQTNSYVLIDDSFKVKDFNIENIKEITHLLKKAVEKDDLIFDLVPSKYVSSLRNILTYCLEGNCISIDEKVLILKTRIVSLQFIVTPVKVEGAKPHLICTIVKSYPKTKQSLNKKNYAYLTSHTLRGPLSNILSLSSFVDDTFLEPYDAGRVRELLQNINQQAEKLDDVIVKFNSVIGNDNPDKPEKIYKASHKVDKVLLLDDDPMVNKIHQRLFKHYFPEIEVVSFEVPARALEYLQKFSTDLILLDMNMPEINGLEFLQLLKDKKIDTDVIIISSSIDKQEKRNALAFKQVKDFLTKPIIPDKIKSLISY